MIKNAFDTENYPEGVPGKLVVGDIWGWLLSDHYDAYPPPEYAIRAQFVALTAEGGQFEVIASDYQGSWVFQVPGSTTVTRDVGEYAYTIEVSRGVDGEKTTTISGFTTLAPGFDTAGDIRSETLIVLQAIRATIKGTASNEQSSYSVAGRSLARRSIEELRELEEEYARRWDSEKAEVERNSGRKADSRKTLIRLDA